MIVISGVLLLIAVVFLVIGLFGPLAWVYASIAVSVLSFVFLLVGVRQRRDVPLAAASPTPAAPRGGAAPDTEPADVTLVPASPRRTGEAVGGAALGGAAAAAATAAVLEERDETPAPARVVERRPATPTRRPTRTTSAPAASRLRGATSERPRAVLPARLANEEAAKKTAAKKTTAKKAAPAAKKAAPAKTTAKKAAPAKKTTAKKAAPAAKKAAPAKKAPAKAAAKKAAPAKKTAAKKSAR
ncbi:MAG TPA: hypothetical protein VHA79_06265 [Mycobacteriales bacterium]|nr:hypothetical protein [Mycobacteriales bacterium]HVX69279.1 hypothetical protein [Mycobacteriales bacterium]